METEIGKLLLIIIITLAVFLVIRELVCWYYKINRMIFYQSETVRLLRKIAREDDDLPEVSRGAGKHVEQTPRKKSDIFAVGDSVKHKKTGKIMTVGKVKDGGVYLCHTDKALAGEFLGYEIEKMKESN